MDEAVANQVSQGSQTVFHRIIIDIAVYWVLPIAIMNSKTCFDGFLLYMSP